MDIVVFIQNAFDTFLQSHFFAALKIFLSIYTVVLIIDIILLLSFRDLGEIVRQGKYGTALVPKMTKPEMNKQWSKIETRLKSGNISEYKVAILEADGIIEGVLKDIGYDSGADMAQKIEMLRVTQPDDAEMIDEVHRMRNRIVFEQDYHPDLKEAESALEKYKSYLKKFDYFQ